MRTDRSPNAALPWVIVFASAVMTLSSSTVRTRAVPPRAVPARLEPAAAEPQCDCGDSCACGKDSPAPAPAGTPDRRDLWLRAARPGASGPFLRLS